MAEVTKVQNQVKPQAPLATFGANLENPSFWFPFGGIGKVQNKFCRKETKNVRQPRVELYLLPIHRSHFEFILVQGNNDVQVVFFLQLPDQGWIRHAGCLQHTLAISVLLTLI